MTAIFLKEVRENVKWALLIGCAFGLLILLEIGKASPFIIYQLGQQRTLFFAPLAGLILGIAQSYFEVRPDNWAFLVHRPVPRLLIFFAKCSVGFLLLYVSMAVPILLATAWTARPGNVATPFH